MSRRRNRNQPRVSTADATLVQLAQEVRKLSADMRQLAQPLPTTVTNASSQAVHAQALLAQSAAANALPDNPLARKLMQLSAQGKPLPNTPEGVTPLQTAMEMNQAPQGTAVEMFAPGAPMRTIPGFEEETGPRQFNYPVAYNFSSQPRATEGTSVAKLRNLALYYDGIQLCESVWFDIINRMEPTVTFDENVIPDGEAENDPKWRDIAAPAQEFVNRPDGLRPFQAWATASVRDVLEIGYAVIYKQRDRAGRIISLDIVDSATMKPLLDGRGRMPTPPWAAYQQYLYGVPAGTYRSDEVEMITETERSDSPYPFSRVERIILRINQALRKQNLDMRRYTDGSVPSGMLFPDVDTGWTPEQCETFEQAFNDLQAGNDRMRVRVKVGPPGATFVNTQSADPEMQFDTFLLNITVAGFGLTMDEVAMTGDSNRSVGQTQENVVYRRVVQPLGNRYAALLTAVVKERYDKRLRVIFKGFEEREDTMLKVQALEVGVKNGAISPSFMAQQMGWRVDLEVPPFVMTKDGPFALEDWAELRQAQMDAKRAGLEFAMSSPGGAMEQQLQQATADKASADADTADEGADGEGTDATPATNAKGSQPKTPTKAGAAPTADKGSKPKPQVKPGAKPPAGKTPAKPPAVVKRSTTEPTKRVTPVKSLGRVHDEEAAHARHLVGNTQHDLKLHALHVFDEVARRGHHALHA